MHYIKSISVSLFLLLVLCSVSLYADKASKKPRYPFLFVHGMILNYEAPVFKYWGTVPESLIEHGIGAYRCNQLAFASHEENAKILKERVLQILELEQSDKINIIAHSKGGIESRYMISVLGMGDHVASLTTLSTPHEGSVMADLVSDRSNSSRYFAFHLLSGAALIAAISNDTHASPHAAMLQLRREYMNEFNVHVVNDSRVYYQSYAAVLNRDHPSVTWKLAHRIMKRHEGDNDGLVSVDSASWGNYRGLISIGDTSSLSHGDIVGVTIGRRITDEDLVRFYIDIISDLAERGY